MWTTALLTLGVLVHGAAAIFNSTSPCAIPFDPILTPSKKPWIVTSSRELLDPPKSTAPPVVGIAPVFVQVRPWIPRVLTPLIAAQIVVAVALKAPVPQVISVKGPKIDPT